ncbi:MAG: cell division protein FtsA [Verrucomicrobiales bacterium]|nr:cell division protein FtsA [Verrucomicrobiales bacterium]
MFNIIPRIFSEKSQIIVGLEIGTSKVSAMVGELTESGGLTIIGGGTAPSRGVRKGEIVNFEKAEEDIRAAIVKAEESADVEVGSVYLGVTGAHLRSLNNRGFNRVESAEHEVSQADVEDVLRSAKAFNKPSENTVLHAIRQLFTVNGQSGIADPVGMKGNQLELDVHVVHGVTTRLQNPALAVRGLDIDVEELVFSGLASSLAVLSPEQKENGALVIDMGAGTTEYVAYCNGVVRHTGILAVGGDHVTNDVSYGLKVSTHCADSLKKKHGSATADGALHGKSISLPNELGLQNKQINLDHLHKIMHARVEETFQLIDAELDFEGLHSQIRSGVVLTGGGARISGIKKLAEEVFELDAAIGTAGSHNGVKGLLDDPENTHAIGLVNYAAIRSRRSRSKGWFSKKAVAA